MKKTVNSTKKINKSYQSQMKSLVNKGQHEKEIFDSLSAGKNSYLRLDRLASSSFDKSWIEIIEGVIFDLGDIIANPRLNTKTEGSIVPVELAKKTNNESVQHLASHTQYIKEVDEYGNVIPSKLLSMYSEDDIHTYENRFIATFVRRLMLFVAKRYEYVTKFAELRNEEVLFFKNKSTIDGAEVEIETKVKVSYENDDEEAQINSRYVDRIFQTRQYILYFYNSPFMKAMKTDKDVRNPIVQTNIIRKNPKYHHCYEVYRFIESYDRLGVNYKVDENYSLFNDEEIKELNRTLFANYVTLKGKDTSANKKTNTKVYKPKILTSLDDESFIYGPLFEGPIEFVRIDQGYQDYLDSKIRKDLPLHPTKKEKEYYEDEYQAKSENRQDLKQKNDLVKRKEKEVNTFEKSVKKILAKREEARLKLLEDEKAAIKREEDALLENARRAIIDASKEDQENNVIKEEPVKEEPKQEEEKKVYVPTVTFDEAANEVWPQLLNPSPLPVEEKKEEEQPQDAPKVKRVIEGEPEEVEVVEEANKGEQLEEAQVVKAANKQEEKKPAIVSKPVSFDEAANEVWPQLNNPKPLPKEEKKEQPSGEEDNKQAAKAAPKKVVAAPAETQQENKSPLAANPVKFEDAANEVWPQLNNPRPLPKEEVKAEEVKEVPKVAPKAQEEAPQVEAEQEQTQEQPKVKDNKEQSQPKAVAKPVSFEEAADEIWPQLNNPKPLPKEENKEASNEEYKKAAPKAKEVEQTKESAPVNGETQPVVEEAQPAGRLIRKQFIRSDGTVAIIYKREKAPKVVKSSEVKKEEAKPAEPKKAEPKEEVKPVEVKKAAPKQEEKPQPKKEEKKENKPQKNVVKSKKSRLKFKK